MKMALTQASHAAKYGDVPVGALIVNDRGRILAQTSNRVERNGDPVAHAEILAITQATRTAATTHLKRCVLVCTLEPCAMCAGAIAHAQLAGVVYGAKDLRAGAITSAADVENLPLGGNSFWHMGGVKAKECAELLEKFFSQLRSNN